MWLLPYFALLFAGALMARLFLNNLYRLRGLSTYVRYGVAFMIIVGSHTFLFVFSLMLALANLPSLFFFLVIIFVFLSRFANDFTGGKILNFIYGWVIFSLICFVHFHFLSRVDTLLAFITPLGLFALYFQRSQSKPFLLYTMLYLSWLYFSVCGLKGNEGHVFSHNLPILVFFLTLLVVFSKLTHFDFLRRLPLPVLLTLFFSGFLAGRVLLLWEKPSSEELRRVLQNPAIHGIFTYTGELLHHGLFQGKPIRFVSEGCDGQSLYLFIDHYAQQPISSAILELNKNTGEVENAFSWSFGTGETFWLDCEDKRLYFASYDSDEVCVLDLQNIRSPKEIIKVKKGTQPDLLYVSSYFRDFKVLLVEGDTRNYFVFHLPSGKQLFSGALPFRKFTSLMGKLLEKENPLQVRKLRRKAWFLRKYFPNGSITSQVDFDSRRNMLFLTIPASGKLAIIDTKAKKVVRELNLEPFVRYLSYDPRRNLVYVSGHFLGNLYVVDPFSGKIVDKVYTGPRVHLLTLSQDGDRLYFASNQGVFYLDLTRYSR